jgi:hypothetical protein
MNLKNSSEKITLSTKMRLLSFFPSSKIQASVILSSQAKRSEAKNLLPDSYIITIRIINLF